MTPCRLAIVATFLGASVLAAGDYGLTVADDPSSECARRSRAPSGTVASAREVADDVARHFRGERSEVKYFTASMGNGFVHFCGRAERDEVYEALMKAAGQDAIANERDLFDYASMLGSERFVEMLDKRLAVGASSSRVAARLARMRDDVRAGMEIRKQRGQGSVKRQ